MAGSVIRSVGWMSRAASGYVAASWATIPPARVSEPVSDSGAPIARIVNGSPSGVSSTESDARHPADRPCPVTTRTSSIAIASAPALRSSLSRSSTSGAPIGPRTVIVMPSPATGSSPAQARIRSRSALDLGDRGRAAGRRPARASSSWRCEARDLRPEPVVVGVQVADEQRQVLGRQRRRADRRRSGPGSGRRRAGRAGTRRAARSELAARGPERSASWRRSRRRRRRLGDGTVRDSRSVRLPANAGTSTTAGSANEMSSPNEPRRVWTKSRQPCDRLELVEQVGRADRRDLVRRREVGRVDEDRVADVEDAGRDGDPLAVDRDRLGAGEPELGDDRPDVAGRHEVVGLVGAGRHRQRRVFELEDEPGARRAGSGRRRSAPPRARC